MKKILFILLALILVSCASPQRVALPTPVAPIPQRMLFPLYVYPSTGGVRWQPVVDANVYRNIDAIVNPHNGPGASIDLNYFNGINKLRAAGIGVYGYVHTTYGARSISAVKADVDTWLAWYAPLVGIFVDEAEYRAGEGDEGYYAELYAYISSKGLKVINNPGIGTTETYIQLADTTCIFESNITKPFVFPSWGWNYPPSKFCYLAHSASVEQMRAAVAALKVSNVEYVYITNATSSYWSSIPPYLAEEAALLAGGAVPPTIIPATPSRTPTITATRTPVTASQTPILVTSTPTRTPTRTPTASIPATAVCEEALSVWVCDKYPYP